MTPARTNQNWLPSIFNEFLDNNWLAERRNATAPAVNIIEDEDEYKVEVAAPGMTREDFKVHINARVPTCAANSPIRSSSRACCCPTTSSARKFRPGSKTA